MTMFISHRRCRGEWNVIFDSLINISVTTKEEMGQEKSR